MSTNVKLSCQCGKVKGRLEVVSSSSFHVECFCSDCQRFANHLGQSNILSKHGATELFQTYPAYMNISEGHEHIRCLQLTPKGLFRWHTACCNTPIANTLSTSNMPFVGILVEFMQFGDEQEKLATLGPIVLKAFGKYAIDGMPADAHPRFPLSFMPKILIFMAKGKLTKKDHPSPFFNNDGQPIIPPFVLQKEH